MSFSLGNVTSAIAPFFNPAQTFKSAIGGLTPQRPDAPQLPASPTLNAPTLPNYPGLSPQEQALLQQSQGYLNQFGGMVNNQNQQQAGGLELQNYINALQGKIAPNQMIAQQKQKDWEALKQQAGQLGIQIRGDTPESAASQSTSGNQMITDFNKRYGALEQNYNLGQQQFGQQATTGRLGLNSDLYSNLIGLSMGLMNPYQQQRLGQFGVQTQQALTNSDIANQNQLNAYQQRTGQTLANYNNALAGYNQNMGLLQSGLGLVGQIGGAYLGGGGGMGAGRAVAMSGNQNFNPYSGSYIQNPQQLQYRS